MWDHYVPTSHTGGVRRKWKDPWKVLLQHRVQNIEGTQETLLNSIDYDFITHVNLYIYIDKHYLVNIQLLYLAFVFMNVQGGPLSSSYQICAPISQHLGCTESSPCGSHVQGAASPTKAESRNAWESILPLLPQVFSANA